MEATATDDERKFSRALPKRSLNGAQGCDARLLQFIPLRRQPPTDEHAVAGAGKNFHEPAVFATRMCTFFPVARAK